MRAWERRLERMRAELPGTVFIALKKIWDIKLPVLPLHRTLLVTFPDATSAERQWAFLQPAICAP